jgi:poly(3-hydroxybutyrate) depolymerase
MTSAEFEPSEASHGFPYFGGDRHRKIMKSLLTSILFLALAPLLRGQATVSLGTGRITGSVTGLSSANPNVTGLSAGISFDLTITATNATTGLSVANHADGIGVYSFTNDFELENRNNTNAADDESLVFTLSNVTGLAPGQSLLISSIGARSASSTTTKQYALFDGATSVSSGSFTATSFAVSVPNLNSAKITATGPTSAPALNSRFLINQVLLTITGGSGGTGGNANAVAKITNAGIDGSHHPFFTFESVAGESYEIQCSTDLISWTPMATLSGTGSSITYTDEFTQAPSVPRQFHRAKTVLTPNGNLANTTLSITQTWEQQPSGYARTAVVQVPAGAGPHPVIILLHGNGGTGAQMIGALDPHVSTAIRVAPSGYLTSWNVDGEASRAPDVAFIRDLIAMLKTYDNVDAGKISIFGISNGSGMTNRLLIELDGAAFQNAGCQVSQMLAKMYHDGNFWFNASGTNAYDQTLAPAKRRRIISINGTSDPLIPYNGGISGIGTFLSAQESIYRFAQAMGETGPQLADSAGVVGTGTNGYSAPFVKYTYRSGQFVHYKLIGGNHGLQVSGSFVYADEAKQLVAAFLLP